MSVIGIHSPTGYYKHKGQALYLKHAHARKANHTATNGKCGIQKLNYCGGRGSGKTTIGILDLMTVALVDAAGPFRTFWSEPNYGDIDRILLPELEQIVPSNLYRLVTKPGYRYIQWASGHKTDLISRFVGNKNKQPGLGANLMGGFHDELAAGFEINKINSIENSIRAPHAPYYFVSSLSTPLRNGYEAYCNDPAATTIHTTSWDNPHISKAVLDSRAASMSPEQVEQELKGNFVALEGQIWNHFVEKPWPLGNIMPNVKYDRTKPFYLSCDLGGSQGSFQIYQLIEPLNPINGRVEMTGKLLCCVEEWTVNNMSFESVLKEIINAYCDGDPSKRAPVCTYIGHDANRKGDIVAMSASMIFNQLGWNWTFPGGRLSSKDLQRSHASNLLYQRRFVVAANKDNNGIYQISKQHYGERKTRGILNMFRRDTYPDPSTGDIFTKDKGSLGISAIEDDRDCFLYVCICWRHPETFDKGYYKRK